MLAQEGLTADEALAAQIGIVSPCLNPKGGGLKAKVGKDTELQVFNHSAFCNFTKSWLRVSPQVFG
jgi:hypothetical protein